MNKVKSLWIEWRSFFVFLTLMFIFRSAIADWYEVPTGSMKPTIIEGDRIFVNKVAYDLKLPFTLVTLASWGDPNRGDIVVFDSSKDDKRLIKRVVGLPGDIIEIIDNQLFVNSESAKYSDVDQSMVSKYWNTNALQSNILPVLYKEEIGHKEHLITVLNQGLKQARYFGPYRVPENHYFMLGDNRDNSADSRFIGAIDRKFILGQANKIVFSTKTTERFFHKLE